MLINLKECQNNCVNLSERFVVSAIWTWWYPKGTIYRINNWYGQLRKIDFFLAFDYRHR